MNSFSYVQADAHSRSEITPEIEELLAKAEKDFYSAIEAERKKRAREHERTSEEGSGQWFGTEEEKRDHGKVSFNIVNSKFLFCTLCPLTAIAIKIKFTPHGLLFLTHYGFWLCTLLTLYL